MAPGAPEQDGPDLDGPDLDGPQERAPGLAVERTRLAWSRTAISVAALGGVALKVNVPAGLTILAIAPLVWQIGRFTPSGSSALASPASRTLRIRVITLALTAVSVLCLIVALLGPGFPGGLR